MLDVASEIASPQSGIPSYMNPVKVGLELPLSTLSIVSYE